MIQKTNNCLYCGEKMESKTAKKKFCSALHRVYYNREKFRGTLGLEVIIKNNTPEFVKYEMESVLPIKITQESQNKTNTDTKKETVSETMPEGLNWKERIEWTHNYKQKLKNLKT